jgi:hypothetical protein
VKEMKKRLAVTAAVLAAPALAAPSTAAADDCKRKFKEGKEFNKPYCAPPPPPPPGS